MAMILVECPVEWESGCVEACPRTHDGHAEADWNDSAQFPITKVLFKDEHTLLLRTETLSYFCNREVLST